MFCGNKVFYLFAFNSDAFTVKMPRVIAWERGCLVRYARIFMHERIVRSHARLVVHCLVFPGHLKFFFVILKKVFDRPGSDRYNPRVFLRRKHFLKRGVDLKKIFYFLTFRVGLVCGLL